MRTVFRIILTIGAGAVIAWASFSAAFWWRIAYDEKVAPSDGQSGLDAAAFGLIVALVCAGLVMLLVVRLTRQQR